MSYIAYTSDDINDAIVEAMIERCKEQEHSFIDSPIYGEEFEITGYFKMCKWCKLCKD